MKKIISLLFAFGLVFSSMPSNSLAAESNEKPFKMTHEQLVTMKEELIKYGVSSKVAESLSKKMKKGQLLDSIIMDEKDAIDVQVVKHENGSEEHIHTFPDGSITITSVENAPVINSGGFTTLGSGITNGSCSSGSGYTNCTNRKVTYNNPGVWSLSFHANYTYLSSGYDYISWAGNEGIWMVMGTTGDPSMRIIRSTETAFNFAEARFSAYLYIGGSYGTLTRSVSLRVGANAASAQGNNFY